MYQLGSGMYQLGSGMYQLGSPPYQLGSASKEPYFRERGAAAPSPRAKRARGGQRALFARAGGALVLGVT